MPSVVPRPCIRQWTRAAYVRAVGGAAQRQRAEATAGGCPPGHAEGLPAETHRCLAEGRRAVQGTFATLVLARGDVFQARAGGRVVAWPSHTTALSIAGLARAPG